MQDIKELTLKELEGKLVTLGAKPYHARQINAWIYQKAALDFAQMSDLSQGLREQLKENFYIIGSKVVKKFISRDKTQKLLLQLKDGNLIEAVLIPSEERATGCVSTQVGCKYACRFCASGLAGFKRNLSSLEIIDEVLHLKKACLPDKLTHLVFMGTGEPLDNYVEVLKAVKMINSASGFNIGARRITISTSGVVLAIQKLAGEGLQVELSVSLHAANNDLRSKLMPINKQYPLKELIQACKEYSAKTNRQITFEYSLIKGLNSGLENAKELSALLAGWKLAKVNLIPANPVKELKVEPADPKTIFSFKDHLERQGVNVTLRRERGEDIHAACGQLRMQYGKK